MQWTADLHLAGNAYSSGKYLNDSSGKRRMAGDIFQDTFGDKGWNEEFLNTNGNYLNVDRDPALDYVAGKAAEAEFEKKKNEMSS